MLLLSIKITVFEKLSGLNVLVFTRYEISEHLFYKSTVNAENLTSEMLCSTTLRLWLFASLDFKLSKPKVIQNTLTLHLRCRRSIHNDVYFFQQDFKALKQSIMLSPYKCSRKCLKSMFKEMYKEMSTNNVQGNVQGNVCKQCSWKCTRKRSRKCLKTMFKEMSAIAIWSIPAWVDGGPLLNPTIDWRLYVHPQDGASGAVHPVYNCNWGTHRDD